LQMPVVHAGVYPHPPIVIPEVGGNEAEKVKATAAAMEEMARRVKASNAESILLITPHGPIFQDAVALLREPVLSGSLARFGVPDIKLTYRNDQHLLDAIEMEADKDGIRTATLDQRSATAYGVQAALDHGAMVPLYFLHKFGVRQPLVHITFGYLPPRRLYAFGQSVQRAIIRLRRRVAVVASADLSHRLTKDAPAGFNPAGAEFDNKLVQLLEKFDVPAIQTINARLQEDAGECGYRSILICLGILDGLTVQTEILSYEAPFGVGYLVADLTPGVIRKAKDAAATREESEHVRLARQTLETFVHSKEIIEPPETSTLLDDKAGAFVTLKIDGELRGCIGTIEPTQDSLAEEIIENAISAGFYDPRFPEIKAEELPQLEYSVDVLSPAEEVSGPEALDPKKYGVIVQSGAKKGLLLPDLDGVDTVERQLDIALQKAGIAPHINYRTFRFLVTRFH
jgi:AmmeMemoRadiSam system protein A